VCRIIYNLTRMYTGRVVQQGGHEELLLEAQGLYATLVSRQTIFFSICTSVPVNQVS
jgi:ABC-type bacteriocin/lantibiotic exporter with double-glycine peptidase domain